VIDGATLSDTWQAGQRAPDCLTFATHHRHRDGHPVPNCLIRSVADSVSAVSTAANIRPDLSY
jgi:hypothetical protein